MKKGLAEHTCPFFFQYIMHSKYIAFQIYGLFYRKLTRGVGSAVYISTEIVKAL